MSNDTSPTEVASPDDHTATPTEDQRLSERERLRSEFGTSGDPLAEVAPRLAATGVDPFDWFTDDVLYSENGPEREKTIDGYRRTFDQWRAHMDRHGRHPAAPNEMHVRTFLDWCREQGWKVRTLKKKFWHVKAAYEYWQSDPDLPIPATYNPFEKVKQTNPFGEPEDKEVPRIPVDELRERIAGIPNIRERAYVVLPLKLGIRAGEFVNMRISDIHLNHSEVRRHYPEMGTHERLEASGYEDVVYIPSRYEREGNKSKRPRFIPLDEEARQVLVENLLARPPLDYDEVFLTANNNMPLYDQKPISRVWEKHFHPEYAETDYFRAVRSHYGRHRFSTWMGIERDLPREWVKYLRGDEPGEQQRDPAGLDSYLHAYYEDVRPVYLDNIYSLL